jgi:wyosine [tRNA(Phe)-imidazoG37] synthetase (radical SAM superfamily)
MSKNHAKIALRPLLTANDGKRDSENTLNKDKDLSGKFCHKPFDFFEAQDLGEGKVFVCCPTWLNISVGKLTKQSVSEAFNSKINQEIRKSILDGNFKYCNHKLCPLIQNDTIQNSDAIINPRHRKIIDNYQIDGLSPIEYNLCYDPSCNLSCPSCRINKVYITEGPIYERKIIIQQKIINEVFGEPHQRKCTINVTGSGDPFGSKIFRDLLFGIDGSKYPNVLINLQTNGVMFTPKYWDNIHKIHDNINSVLVSLDAATEETYDIVRRGGNWSILMKNLNHLSDLKQRGKIKFLRLDFVVQKTNYKEMSDFVSLCKKLKVDECYFSLVSDWGTWSVEEYKKHAIWKKDHKEFNDFIEVMKNKIFDDQIVNLGNVTEYRNYVR